MHGPGRANADVAREVLRITRGIVYAPSVVRGAINLGDFNAYTLRDSAAPPDTTDTSIETADATVTPGATATELVWPSSFL
jgi:hypothetical protein